MLLAVGMQIRTADGSRAGRVRCAARTSLAWSPFLIWLAIFQGGLDSVALNLATILISLVGLGFTLAKPEQGPHDRVAGTYLVPK